MFKVLISLIQSFYLAERISGPLLATSTVMKQNLIILHLLAVTLLASGCAAPTALTVISIGAKVIASDVVEAHNRPGPIEVDELLARARGDLSLPDQKELRLEFMPDQVEPDADQRAWLDKRLAELGEDASITTWRADVLAGPASATPGSRASFVAHLRAASVGGLLGPSIELRSIRYSPGLPPHIVVLSLRPLRKEPPRA